MTRQPVKVKRELIEACMRCPLCEKLLKEATTISLCLHTFCRKCIYKKLSDEEVDCCPVCNIDLGVLPVEKLRPDHNLQDIRAKIFPLKRRKVTAPEVMPTVALPAKRKERSLSSLVVSTPKVPIQAGMTGRRSKAGVRKSASVRNSFTAEESDKKEDYEEDQPKRSNSLESPDHVGHNKRQDSSVVEPSYVQQPKADVGDDFGIIEGKADLWTPLTCLVEAATRKKLSGSHVQGLPVAKSDLSNISKCEPFSPVTKSKAESSNGHDSVVHIPRAKNKLYGQDPTVQGDKNGANSLQMSVKHRRLSATRKRVAIREEEQNASNKLILDATRSKNNRRNNPIWFSLVASDNQKGDATLPQISSCYLRIKDGKMPVSLIQKYLVKKLDLPSEAEVEIMCRGQPILPTLQLHSVVDLWFRTASAAKKAPASVGSSAKDFVMVLSYCQKVQAS